MALYVLDTDHLSLYGRNHPQVIAQLQANQGQIATTAINVEEQFAGAFGISCRSKRWSSIVKCISAIGRNGNAAV